MTARDGAPLAYEETGAGRTIVLLHGGVLDGRMWDDEFERLGRAHRVIRYDARGHGRSSPAAGDFAHHEDLYDLLAAWPCRARRSSGCRSGPARRST